MKREDRVANVEGGKGKNFEGDLTTESQKEWRKERREPAPRYTPPAPILPCSEWKKEREKGKGDKGKKEKETKFF